MDAATFDKINDVTTLNETNLRFISQPTITQLTDFDGNRVTKESGFFLHDKILIKVQIVELIHLTEKMPISRLFELFFTKSKPVQILGVGIWKVLFNFFTHIKAGNCLSNTHILIQLISSRLTSS